MRLQRLLVALAVPLLATTAVACGDDEEEGEGAFSATCDLKPADTNAALPAGIPAGVSGATFFELQTQGSTKRYFAYAQGDDVVKVRDAIRSEYEKAGYEIEGSDAEPPAEAEFEWKKDANEGSVQVTPMCRDTVRVRYRVGSA